MLKFRWFVSWIFTSFESSLKVKNKEGQIVYYFTYLSNFNKKEKVIQPIRNVIQNLNWSLVSFKWWKEAVQMVWKETQPMDPPSWGRQGVIVLKNKNGALTLCKMQFRVFNIRFSKLTFLTASLGRGQTKRLNWNS